MKSRHLNSYLTIKGAIYNPGSDDDPYQQYIGWTDEDMKGKERR